MLRKLFALVLAVAASVASATTLNPIQLLNPTGSASGQAIISTGASTAPAWGNISVGGLSPIAGNTVLANATGSSAAPVAFAMPSCSATGNALLYTSGTGITCGSGYALLASPTFTGTATFANLAATGTITPSQTNGIVGTTTNNNANAGSVGEYVSATSGAVTLTTGISANVTSISLTAGDWDVHGYINFSAGSGDTITNTFSGVNSISASLPAAPLNWTTQFSTTQNTSISTFAPMQRFSLSATTTIYLVAQAGHSGGTATATGHIRARRVR